MIAHVTLRVVELALGVRWEPNAPEAVLVTPDFGPAALAIRAHFDDTDERTVVLRWTHCLAVIDGPYNDEALNRHPLYEAGLKDVHWLGEVHDSAWLPSVSGAIHPAAAAGLRHFILPLKERTIELAAHDVEVLRSELAPLSAAPAAASGVPQRAPGIPQPGAAPPVE
jgi:hypothetical protein